MHERILLIKIRVDWAYTCSYIRRLSENGENGENRGF